MSNDVKQDAEAGTAGIHTSAAPADAPSGSRELVTPMVRDQPIGELLVEAGVLKEADVAKIVAYAHERGIRFGDAAIELKLVTAEALAEVLAFQFDYPVVQRETSLVSPEVMVAFDSRDPALDELREVRAQIQLRWLSQGDFSHKTIAVISPERGDGRTFVAANLAVAFSQTGLRTLLLDGDLRNGRIHQLFGLRNTSGLSALLSGRAFDSSVNQVQGLRDLSVISMGGEAPNPGDLLARETLPALLHSFANTFDVVIIDTPATEVAPDAKLIASHAKGCVLVARKDVTRLDGLQRLSRDVRELGATIIGTVLLDD